jgi:hypothetical protein
MEPFEVRVPYHNIPNAKLEPPVGGQLSASYTVTEEIESIGSLKPVEHMRQFGVCPEVVWMSDFESTCEPGIVESDSIMAM